MIFGVLALGCAPAAGPAQVTPPGATVRETVKTGLDVLVRDSAAQLRGLRIGLITNHTGVANLGARTASAIDVLHNHPNVRLVKLFAPEHGFSGRAAPGEKVGDTRDQATGLPVLSLYGQTQKPTPEMLQGIDALVFDIQDVGSRYYTYMWTMAHALKAAAENRIRFVVLDRPVPIGGSLIHGNVLDTAFATFVGLYPVPMRHGMTVGEMARFLNAEYRIGANLTVVPMEGWRRSMWYDETGLPWIPPSPNMPSVEAAAHYPGTCLFEGTNLSTGRGTDAAFQQIGAPWLQNDVIVQRLRARNLPGVRIDAVSFTPKQPGDGKYADTLVRGIKYTVTDRNAYDPTVTAIATLVEIIAVQKAQLEWRVAHFDRLAGTDRVRTALIAGQDVSTITASWAAQLAAFEAKRRPYLLY